MKGKGMVFWGTGLIFWKGSNSTITARIDVGIKHPSEMLGEKGRDQSHPSGKYKAKCIITLQQTLSE